jgi:dihydroorotate dehydrogenase (fumarate)
MSIDLRTDYLGLSLRNPLIASSCPLTAELDVLRRLEDAGAAAAVLPSLFAEQYPAPDVKEPDYSFSTDPLGQTLSWFRELKHYNRGPDAYLNYIETAKRSVSIPIIGSINGTKPGEWIRYARLIEQAGADALEANLYSFVADLDVTSEQVEARYLELVTEIRKQITIPLAVKLSPSFTALGNMARRIAEAGANGLVLFNRFLQPDVDLDSLKVSPRLVLSTIEEARLPLRWIAILRGRIPISLAATGGIDFPDGVLKALLVGSDVVEIASALYRHGVDHLRSLLGGVEFWMESAGFPSVEKMKGALSQLRCPDPTVFERANYTKALCSFVNEVS